MPLAALWQSHAANEAAAEHDLQRLRKQQQTARARTASLLSRQKRKLEKAHEATKEEYLSPITSATIQDSSEDVVSFQQTYFASAREWNPLDKDRKVKATADGRSRAVWLYFQAFAAAVKSLFLGDRPMSSEPGTISHVISININDDTDIKLATGRRRSTEVRSVMNNIQHHIVAHAHGPSSGHGPGESGGLDAEGKSAQETGRAVTWFCFHQPLVTLGCADTKGVFSEFLSWTLWLAGQCGWRMLRLGAPANLFQHVRFHVLIYCGDALRTNDAVFNQLGKIITAQPVHAPPGQQGKSTSLQIHCQIHQLCLVRKTLALGFDGYWSNLVRLGHLLEGHGFRSKFYSAMTKVIRDSFQYFPVTELPSDFESWHRLKIKQLKLFSDGGNKGKSQSASRRLRTLHQLLLKDNGDPNQPMFVHWCLGPSCCAGGCEEAVSRMVEQYLDLFAYFSVPLLYRWKHAGSANSFVRDGFFLRRILPRALSAIPRMK